MRPDAFHIFTDRDVRASSISWSCARTFLSRFTASLRRDTPSELIRICSRAASIARSIEAGAAVVARRHHLRKMPLPEAQSRGRNPDELRHLPYLIVFLTERIHRFCKNSKLFVILQVETAHICYICSRRQVTPARYMAMCLR